MVPVIGVLALQGDVREHLAALAACGARAVPVRRPAELAAVDAVVLPGGESTTMSRLLVTFELLEPLRARIAEGMPAYGSCAGMILLAREVLDGRPDQEQLGGLDVVVRRNAFGRQVDSFETDLDVDGVVGDPVRAVFIRAPWVEKAGGDVEILATVPDRTVTGAGTGEAAGRPVAVRQGQVLATAFHPELTGDLRIHDLFVQMLR
ncbi:pyridoxal 5'-phosphate synthase glutaminase subunit PdxT [Pseudonocardia hydrocarbonoxydans]|uniref:pyridoxal 5'-phosphate synthase glutaminase subunit PdxT n=1 Tax=Pseudonocardia hydrocarbonoxydans TaxID=76726 RepID=UPI00114153C3|nr:pyridoxal 5'-phosphate synthase glutaminase subunit PdxT [Pseudonocardia hydrocarbonoxydans]